MVFLQAGRKLAAKIGFDSAVAFTVLARLVQAGGGVGTVIFIAHFLSKEEQGYYYTFGSLIGIQVFFELGLSGIITQYAAHEMAHLTWGENGVLQGEYSYQSRLSSLLHFCVKWFSILAGGLFFLLMALGYYFFSKFNNHLHINWQVPWTILSLSTACFLALDPVMGFVEGLGRVKEVARIRLITQTVSIVLVILCLSAGFKLYSSALVSLIIFFLTFCLLYFSSEMKSLSYLWKQKGEWKVNYRTEVFPYQWRIALSWISGYFIFQLFNPVLFATEGPKVAGQMGMTLTALNGILQLSISWVGTKTPLFSKLISTKNFKELDITFFKSLRQSGAVFILCALALIVFIFGLKYIHLPLGERFLPFFPLILLCVTFLANLIIFSLAFYLRCHKKEPLLLSSVTLGILSCISTYTLGHMYGVTGITLGYALLIIVISLPWVTTIFFKMRKLWHSNN